MGRHTATPTNSARANMISSTVSPATSPPQGQNVGQHTMPTCGTQEVRVDLFSRTMEAVFTAAIIFSTALMPFVLCTMFIPDLMVSIMMPPAVYMIILYILVMILVGAKISSLFGCSLWDRLTSEPAKKQAYQQSRVNNNQCSANTRVDTVAHSTKSRSASPTNNTGMSQAIAYTMRSTPAPSKGSQMRNSSGFY